MAVGGPPSQGTLAQLLQALPLLQEAEVQHRNYAAAGLRAARWSAPWLRWSLFADHTRATAARTGLAGMVALQREACALQQGTPSHDCIIATRYFRESACRPQANGKCPEEPLQLG